MPRAQQEESMTAQENSAAFFDDIISSGTLAHISSPRNKTKPPADASCRRAPEKCTQLLTWQVREEEDALVEAIGQKAIPELLQYGHANAEGEGRVTQQQRVPQVEDLVKRKHIYVVRTEIDTTKGRFYKMTENKSP